MNKKNLYNSTKPKVQTGPPKHKELKTKQEPKETKINILLIELDEYWSSRA